MALASTDSTGTSYLGYSSVHHAARQGHATFVFDRLSIGTFEKADPVSESRVPLRLAIAIELIAKLRVGRFSGMTFRMVVGIGHSLGSRLTEYTTVANLKVLDATVLNGLTASLSDILLLIARSDFAVAAQDNPQRFGNLASE